MKPQSPCSTGLEEVLLPNRRLTPAPAEELHVSLEYLELPISKPEGPPGCI